MGPIETIDSGHNDAVVNAENHKWGLETIETCNSDAKVAVLLAKNTDESWDQQRLVILMLTTLFCMHKTTGEGWDP